VKGADSRRDVCLEAALFGSVRKRSLAAHSPHRVIGVSDSAEPPLSIRVMKHPFPPTFNPATMMEETIDDIRAAKKAAGN